MLTELIKELLDKWEAKAEKTSTPLDDVVVELLKTLVDLLI